MSFEAGRETTEVRQATKLIPINHIGELLVGVRARTDLRRPGQLDFIGGGAEADDCCSMGTGVREAAEEIGLKIQENDLIFINMDMSPSKRTLVTFYWTLLPEDFRPVLQTEEIESVHFLPPGDVMLGLRHEGQKQMLGQFLEQAKSVPRFDFSEELALQNLTY